MEGMEESKPSHAEPKIKWWKLVKKKKKKADQRHECKEKVLREAGLKKAET